MAILHSFLHEDMITDILSRLSVKSLIRFKSVSKRWLSSTTDPKFITSHLQQSSKNPSLLFIDYRRGRRSTPIISLLHNAELTTSHRVCIPQSMKYSDAFKSKYISNPGTKIALDIRIVGSSGGLLCALLFNRDREYVLWNPAIRKFRPVKCPEHCLESLAQGFGYNNKINDYKLVRIGYLYRVPGSASDSDSDNNNDALSDYGSDSDSYYNDVPDFRRRQVDSGIQALVFSWRTDSWTVVEDTGLLNGDFSDDRIGSVSTKDELYWTIRKSTGELFYSDYSILAFDLVKDEFRRIDFPHIDDILLKGYKNYSWQITNFKDSLLSHVLSSATNTDIWILKKNGSGDHSSGQYWEKMFSISQEIYHEIRTWREKIIITQASESIDEEQLSVVLYDPISQRATDQLPLRPFTIIFDYVESLTPVDGTNSII